MLATRVARLHLASLKTSVKPVTLSTSKRLPTLLCRTQGFASESGSRASTLRKVKGTATLKESLMAPAGDGGLNRYR